MPHETSELDKNVLQQCIRLTAWLVSRVLLLIVFFGIFLPVGFIMRVFGSDPLHRKLESTASSYYRPSKQRAREHMDKPF